MIRWLTRTSSEDLARHDALARQGPAATAAYDEGAVFWRELYTERAVFPLTALLMGLAVCGGTGFGALALTDAAPWCLALALAGAGLAELVSAPHDAMGNVRPGASEPAVPRGARTVALALLYLLPAAAELARSAPEQIGIRGPAAAALVNLAVLGAFRPLRWLASWGLALAWPLLVLRLMWHGIPGVELTGTMLALTVAGGLTIALLLRTPSGFGLWPLSAFAGELAVLALWVEIWAGAGTRAPEPHLTLGLAAAAVTGLFGIGLLEAAALDPFALVLLLAAPAIHLGGLCVVPPAATGPLVAHLGLATLEFLLLLWLFHVRWRAWRVAEYAPRMLRPTPAVVARLDRGQDIPVETEVADA